MPDETEIKLKIRDLKAFQRILKRLGAKPVGSATGRVHEEKLIFDTPDGDLAKHDQLISVATGFKERELYFFSLTERQGKRPKNKATKLILESRVGFLPLKSAPARPPSSVNPKAAIPRATRGAKTSTY